ncbi:hypothetical protein [Brachyspira hampsonii]|uniref:Uncharacterized protein n=1 Tax=Brachyspira hampsonii TaxID=1287055 RepID=A0AAC9TWE0_9SPIR|nr:hypothetical protein [Brachyspira hampsonii]ASJ21741.1 hypothetical protein BHAMNSH16_08845 [Brachyspira hampsonii]ELV06546.1 hypothetical protein H263_03501 [Brachyspira hampsonii 30599]MBW5379740.1 hypothetical protein [Brachyspira hampsonii]MBW5409908.1 hypothetical protein [Brachyspira hampsonii]OEJ18804.1 hypothetical protein A9496_06235 [Brachyspira hampsonii]
MALSRKIFVILTLLILFSFNLFANFKFGISPRIGADINIAETKDYNSVLLDPRLDINFQIGYGFKLNNVNLLSGIDLLFDFGINEHMVSIMDNNTSLINRVTAFGIYTGAALKFDLTKNNQHLLAGIALGVQFNPLVDANYKSVPISPYIRLSFERKFFETEKIDFIAGVHLSYENMIFNANDMNNLFSSHNVRQYHSVGLMLSFGFFFENR